MTQYTCLFIWPNIPVWVYYTWLYVVFDFQISLSFNLHLLRSFLLQMASVQILVMASRCFLMPPMKQTARNTISVWDQQKQLRNVARDILRQTFPEIASCRMRSHIAEDKKVENGLQREKRNPDVLERMRQSCLPCGIQKTMVRFLVMVEQKKYVYLRVTNKYRTVTLKHAETLHWRTTSSSDWMYFFFEAIH
jgi:hypothetical protein